MTDQAQGPHVDTWEALYGPNVGWALELYERYLEDANTVDPETRAIFERLGPRSDEDRAIATLERHSSPTEVPTNGKTAGAPRPITPEAAPQATISDLAQRIVLAARLARSIREYGHLDAEIDPLGAERPGDPMLDWNTHQLTAETLEFLPGTIVFPEEGERAGSALDAIRRLHDIYAGSIGYEFDHVQDFEERAWLHGNVEAGTFRQPMSRDSRVGLLRRLSQVEGFERFLHTAFQGQKRFSLEGNDMLVPMLDEIVRSAAGSGNREVLIGMAHRGRLNVLAHV